MDTDYRKVIKCDIWQLFLLFLHYHMYKFFERKVTVFVNFQEKNWAPLLFRKVLYALRK